MGAATTERETTVGEMTVAGMTAGEMTAGEMTAATAAMAGAMAAARPTVFDDTTVHEFALDIPDRRWSALEGGHGWGHGTNEYYPATFTGLGEELEVGIRLKGSSTYQIHRWETELQDQVRRVRGRSGAPGRRLLRSPQRHV